MLRGIVYSLSAICVFLLCVIGVFSFGNLGEESINATGGWLMLVALFGVGPAFFGIGYWHHRRLYPKEPHWDSETGE